MGENTTLSPSQQGFKNESDALSTFDKARVGIGRAFVEAPQAIKQDALHIAAMDGFVSPQTANAYDQMLQSQASDYNAGVGGTTPGKIGEFIGNAAITVPFAGPAGAAERGIMASALRSGVAGAASGALTQPSVSGDFAHDKANQVIGGALFGAGINTGLRSLGRAAEEIYPANAGARILNAFNKGANQTPFAQEGEALAQRTGIQLTPAQISGGKAQTAAENLARQSIFSSDAAFAADRKITDQWRNYVQNTLDNLSPTQ